MVLTSLLDPFALEFDPNSAVDINELEPDTVTSSLANVIGKSGPCCANSSSAEQLIVQCHARPPDPNRRSTPNCKPNIVVCSIELVGILLCLASGGSS